MGSGASNQVKLLETKIHYPEKRTGSASVTSGKEKDASQSGWELRRTKSVSNEATPRASYSSEKTTPPTAVMAQKPSQSTSLHVSNVQSTSMTSTSSSQPQSSLEVKVRQLQKELGESESEKLDLQDRIQALEERLLEVTSASALQQGSMSDRNGKEAVVTDLQETLNAKDSYIQQMERQLAAVEAESKKVRVRLKKKIRTLTTQLNEAKQESSIAQLELKERNSDLQDQLRQSSLGSIPERGASGGDDEESDPKFKVILDLSAEVSEQADKIASMERMLKEKNKEIEQLKLDSACIPKEKSWPIQIEPAGQSVRSQISSQQNRPQPPQQGVHNRQMKVTGSSFQSGVTPVESVRDYSSMQGQRPISKIGARHKAAPKVEALALQRQSTALSDSDSDWEVEMTPNKNHSAPARTRVKSAATSGEEKPATNHHQVQEKWSVATDDNDLNFTSEARPAQSNSGRYNRSHRKSALKTRLERERIARSKELMGPSLAFAAPASDQLSDISSTPTPRVPVSSRGSKFMTSDVMTFAT